MSIESKDVANAGLTPTFTERSISGTARVQNNRTLLLASVAQDTQSNGRVGLPILGLIPILGRLFTAPTKSNRQVDIVIAVTPRVLRAPNILPEDESERETGSLASPTSSSLAEMLRREDIEDQFANGRRLPNTANIQLPDQPVEDAPAYVPANAAQQNKTTSAMPNVVPTSKSAENQPAVVTPRPIDTSVKTLNVLPTVDSTEQTPKAPTGETKQQTTPQPQLK
jgi:general secretion pathway protein D